MSDSVAKNNISKRSKLYNLSFTAVMTAVMCVLAPMSIPIGPVPISFTILAIFLALYLLGWKMGTLSFILYLFIGMIGLPVFSGFSGGLGKLMGPTGGYIIGFLPMALLAGIVIEKVNNRAVHFVAMVLGTAICYAFGTAWFCVVTQTEVAAALSVCVIPFIPADIIKIVIAVVVGPVLRKLLLNIKSKRN